MRPSTYFKTGIYIYRNIGIFKIWTLPVCTNGVKHTTLIGFKFLAPTIYSIEIYADYKKNVFYCNFC